jgi:hypothetical protein
VKNFKFIIFKFLLIILLFPTIVSKLVVAEVSYQQKLAELYCEPGNKNLSFITFEGTNERISTGNCQFNDYQIEFYQYKYLAHSCYDRNYLCGIESDSRDINGNTVIVKDTNGNVVATNIDIDEKAPVIELFRMPTSFPYMVLRTNLGGARSLANLHFFTSIPIFKQVTSIGPISGWRDDGKYIYSNEQGEWLVDKFITVPTPHLSALSDWLHFPVTYKFVDDRLVRADEHIKANLKIYSESELANITEEALQIRTLIDGQTDNKWNTVNLLFSGKTDSLSGRFFSNFTNFVYEGQENLAWQFFEQAIPDSYDILPEGIAPVSMYATKSIMKETMKNWIKKYFPLGVSKD